jgi:alkanesulfonate monooxygenase SsuD/methylene tetrahydromethanopterin reductase-like flavin-dependent oxidoreductase (luciferase family)
VRLGISITNYTWAGGPAELTGHLREVAQRVDAAGADTLWIGDHLLQVDPNAEVTEPMLEAATTLGFLAAATSQVGLGTMVTWASLRPPAVTVKAVTTLHVLSGGRAWFGVGAGYQQDEASMLDLPFSATRDRFDLLEELLQLAAHMWDGDESPFVGAHHRLERPIASPRPATRPRVLVGGGGERRTLPLVARYADACNLFDIPDGGVTLRRKLEVLRAACEDVGRDPATVEVTLSSRLAPGETTPQFVERCAGLAELGVQHVVLIGNGAWTEPDLAVALDAIPELREIGDRNGSSGRQLRASS